MIDTKRDDIECIEHCWIPMRDGVRLSARLWLPVRSVTEPVPAILEYIPYRKRDMVRLRDEGNHPYFTARGYASMRVDMRGSGDSEGTKKDMYGPEELDDAIEVIDWIARQPWCNGKLGMMGTSWGGTASLQAASRQPDALKAIIAVCATNNRFDDDIHHMGGCLLTDTVEWGATLPAILSAAPDPLTVGKEWRRIWEERLAELDFPLANWIRHESRDSYWQFGAVNENPDSISCPILAIGGWSDRYSNTVMNVLKDCHDQCWGIVGPWGHHYPDQGTPGPGICFQTEAVRWWDYWLKDIDNGVGETPKLRVWVQGFSVPENKKETGTGRWVSESSWPSDNIAIEQYGFSSKALIKNHKSEEATVSIPWNLQVGLASGDTGYFGREGGLPLDQHTDDVHSLCFETEPLTEPLEILGRVALDLRVSINQPNALLAIRLNDVSPTGDVSRVTYAVRNLALDDNGQGFEIPSINSTVDCKIAFPNTAYRFEIGHRIRISISSSYWPLIWPSPKAVDITLYQEGLELGIPVRINSEQAHIDFDPPITALTREVSHVVTTSPSLTRSTYFDSQTGRQFLKWHQPTKTIHLTDIDLDFSFEAIACHSIDFNDPNSASTQFQHRLHFKRKNWSVEVIGLAALTSDEVTFYPSGSVEVRENEVLVFENQWAPKVLRKYS